MSVCVAATGTEKFGRKPASASQQPQQQHEYYSRSRDGVTTAVGNGIMAGRAAGKSRYQAGWGAKEAQPPTAAPSMKLSGKTCDEIKAGCSRDNLFEDPDFPAVPSSIFYSTPTSHFVWKRPHVSKFMEITNVWKM